MPRQVPAGHTFDWSTSATLPLNASCWLFGPGQLQTAQHAALTGLPPRLVARPQHADGEAAVRVESGAEVALHGGRALLLADLLDAGGRRRRGVGPVLAAGEGAHVHRLGDLEAVVVLALDDLGRVRRAVGPVQAVAALGVVERVVAARAEGDRAGGQARRGRPFCGSAVMSPAMSSPPSAVNNSARRVDVGLQAAATTPPRCDGCRSRLVRVSEQSLALGCLRHPLHCDRRVRRCDK